jgi:uncharacterized protein
MAGVYADTSMFVAALTAEERTDDAQRWLAQPQHHPIAISDWTITEFAAALSIKRRTGEIDDHQQARSMAVFDRIANDSLRVEAVSRNDFYRARTMSEQSASGLRAGDALHVAIAAQRELTLVSLDKVMVRAAIRLGVEATLL